MKTNVIPIKTDYDPDDLLEYAKGKYKDVMILGWTEPGGIKELRSKELSNAELVYLLETAKLTYLGVDID